MKISELFRILDELKYKIFRELDKAGNHRRVDEGAARQIIESAIKALKSKYDNDIS